MEKTAQSGSFKHNYGLKVLHLFPHYHSLGGVEAVLRFHEQKDHSVGVYSELLIYTDDEAASEERVHCLGISSSDSVGTMRRKFARVTERFPNRIVIYHALWAIPYLAPLDGAERRMTILHGNYADSWAALPRYRKFLDGFICVNHQILEKAQTMFRDLANSRIIEAATPISPPESPGRRGGFKTPVQLGYAGRLAIPDKRVDRIPTFCTELDQLGLNYRFKLLGDGPDRKVLEQTQNKNLSLAGLKHGSAYWQALKEWDFITFFSDREGTPIALLEALSQGIIPIYPRIDSGGDRYVAEIDPGLLYPPGDMTAAAQIVRRMMNLPESELAAVRDACRKSVLRHTGSIYLKTVYDFAEKMRQLPRISTSSTSLSVRAISPLTLTQVDTLSTAVRRFIK